MREQLEDMWGSVLAIAPKLALFLIILIVGWIVAKLIAKAVDKILERVGFDRAVERGGIRRALERSKYDASTIVSKIVYFGLLLIVLHFAFGVFGPNPVSELIAGVIAFLPRLFIALVIVVVAAAIAAAVRDIVSNALSGFSYGRMLGTHRQRLHSRAGHHRGAQSGGHRPDRDHAGLDRDIGDHRRHSGGRRWRWADQADAAALGELPRRTAEREGRNIRERRSSADATSTGRVPADRTSAAGPQVGGR